MKDLLLRLYCHDTRPLWFKLVLYSCVTCIVYFDITQALAADFETEQQIIGTAQSISQDPARPETVSVWVIGPLIDVHRGPAKGYPITNTLETGDQLFLIREYTNWAQVSVKGREGWIHVRDYSKLKDANGRRLTQEQRIHAGLFAGQMAIGTLDGASQFQGTLGYLLSEQLRFDVVLGHTADSWIQGRQLYGQLNIDLNAYGQWQPYFNFGYGVFDADGLFSGINQFDAFKVGLGIRHHLFGNIHGSLEVSRELFLIPGPNNIHADGFRLGIMTFF